MIYNYENRKALEDIYFHDCAFWGGGNAGYHLGIDEDPAYFRRFVTMQEQNRENYRHSLLDQGTRYLSVIMQLIGGDELKITCETVEVTEASL